MKTNKRGLAMAALVRIRTSLWQPYFDGHLFRSLTMAEAFRNAQADDGGRRSRHCRHLLLCELCIYGNCRH